jgi:hypothetical protein
MAMIICPRCGEQVSDKAKKCVHCGEVLIQEEMRYCVECGAVLEDTMLVCPHCGCPIEDTQAQNTNEKPQKVEVTGVKLSNKIKKIVGIIVVLLIVGGMTAFGITQNQKKKAAEEYSNNLESATIAMLTGSSEAETCGNLIKQVWYNSIYKEKDDNTDKYTRPNGYFVSDFNDALSNLFVDTSFCSKISSIEDNQETVNELMKELKNPPDEYKDAYDALTELYNAYISLTNCATDPSGSLQTYSSTFNDADTNTANCYNAMKLYLEN